MTGDDSSATDTMQLKCRAMRGPSKFNSQSGCRCALASKSRCPLQREVAWTWMSRTENWVRGLICSEADFLPAFLWVCVCFFFFSYHSPRGPIKVTLNWPRLTDLSPARIHHCLLRDHVCASICEYVCVCKSVCVYQCVVCVFVRACLCVCVCTKLCM